MSSPWEHQAQLRKTADGMGDPWQMDYFAPPSANPVSPYTKRRYVRPVPEIDSLFGIQKRMVQCLQNLETDDPESARANLEQAYRMLNRYLRHYDR